MNARNSQAAYLSLAVTLASFLTPFMGSSVTVAVPTIGADFHMGAVALNWVVTAYLLSTAAFLLPMGRAADLYGRRRLFASGMLAHTLMSLICGLAPSGRILIVARFGQGITAAMIFSTNIAMLTSAYPPARRGRILGLNVAAVYLGLSAGPVLGGLITQHLGWRYLFFLNVVLGLPAFLIAQFKVTAEWTAAEHSLFDGLGALLYTLGLTAFLYGLATVEQWPARFILAVGLILLTLFVWRELHTRDPLLEFSMFRSPAFAFSNLAALIHYSATFGVGLLLSYYLQSARHLNAQTAGLVMLSQPVMMALVSPLAGRLSDRIEPRLPASLGMALTCLGLVFFIFLRVTTPLTAVIAIQLLMGMGFGLFSSPNTNAVMNAADHSRYGVASAILATMRMTGQAFSMALVALFFAVHLGNIEISAADPALLMNSLRISFIVFSITCFLGIFASLARGNGNPADVSP